MISKRGQNAPPLLYSQQRCARTSMLGWTLCQELDLGRERRSLSTLPSYREG
jgi:hypothetical protein